MASPDGDDEPDMVNRQGSTMTANSTTSRSSLGLFLKGLKGRLSVRRNNAKTQDSTQEACPDATECPSTPPESSSGSVSKPLLVDLDGVAAKEMHTFKLVMALTGDGLTTVSLPTQPIPTVLQLRELLRVQGITGKMVVDGHVLHNDDPLPMQDSGTTMVQLVKNESIEVKEAGYYNGVYEEVDQYHGRPVFKIVAPDHPKAGLDRWIYYSKGPRTPGGWKCSDMFGDMVEKNKHEGWDMLREVREGPGDDLLEGKWALNNGGTDTKPNAPRISRLNPTVTRSRTQDQLVKDKKNAEAQEVANVEETVCAGCFNGEANVQMADGSHKEAQHVVVGDMLASDNGRATQVIACVMEAKAVQQLAQLGDLQITLHHPVVFQNQWMVPLAVEGARLVEANIQLYNFITRDCDPIVVEGFMATSIGTYCQGLHDMANPEHLIWGTERIVNIYRQHPQWPNIISTSDETIAAVTTAMAGGPPPLWKEAEAQERQRDDFPLLGPQSGTVAAS